jgi:hypothetical protein
MYELEPGPVICDFKGWSISVRTDTTGIWLSGMETELTCVVFERPLLRIVPSELEMIVDTAISLVKPGKRKQ